MGVCQFTGGDRYGQGHTKVFDVGGSVDGESGGGGGCGSWGDL